MKRLATVAFVALCIATATAAPSNLSAWVGRQRRNFNPDGKREAAGLYGPAGLVTDGKTFYVTETYNNALRNVTLDGVATTMVGGWDDGFGSRTGYWNETQLGSPQCITMSWDNTTVYIGGSTGVIAIDLATSNSSRKTASFTVEGLAFDANNTLWLAASTGVIGALWRAPDFGQNNQNLHAMFGGNAGSGFSDGIGKDAQFGSLGEIAIHYPDQSDLLKTMLVILDQGANTIRGAHTGNMSVVTLAGVAGSASFQDGPRGIGMLADLASITIPLRGKAKHAYIGSQSVVRRLDLVSGELTTILGQWRAKGLVYSVDPWKAAFGGVGGLVEHDNRLYLSLTSFNTIATLELNTTATFAVSAAVSPATGIVAVAAALVATLLL